jgi:hypothetical protein
MNSDVSSLQHHKHSKHHKHRQTDRQTDRQTETLACTHRLHLLRTLPSAEASCAYSVANDALRTCRCGSKAVAQPAARAAPQQAVRDSFMMLSVARSLQIMRPLPSLAPLRDLLLDGSLIKGRTRVSTTVQSLKRVSSDLHWSRSHTFGGDV